MLAIEVDVINFDHKVSAMEKYELWFYVPYACDIEQDKHCCPSEEKVF